MAAILAGHLHDEDPVAGLQDAMFEICRVQSADRGIWEVVSSGSRGSHRDLARRLVLPVADQLVRRATATGRLTSFETNDLAVLVWIGGALTAHFGDASTTVWPRYLQLALNGGLSDDDPARRAVEHRAPTVDEIDSAMSTLRPPARSARA